VVRASAACTDPVVHDAYDGYHVGVPGGWSLSVADGFVVVHEDRVGSIESVVDPVVLAKGQSPASFFRSALAALMKDVQDAGNATAFRSTGATAASLTGRAGTIGITGQDRVLVRSYASAHGPHLAVFSAYWAPPAKLASLRAPPAAIGVCYGPEATVLSTATSPSQTTASGGVQQVERLEFLGSDGGNVVRGIAGVQATIGGRVASGTVRLVMSTRPQWNSLTQALLRVADGIQHDFTQGDLALLRVQQQLQGLAQQVAGFDHSSRTRRPARSSRPRTARSARAARTGPATTPARPGASRS